MKGAEGERGARMAVQAWSVVEEACQGRRWLGQ
jgi:hypothetical protein